MKLLPMTIASHRAATNRGDAFPAPAARKRLHGVGEASGSGVDLQRREDSGLPAHPPPDHAAEVGVSRRQDRRGRTAARCPAPRVGGRIGDRRHHRRRSSTYPARLQEWRGGGIALLHGARIQRRDREPDLQGYALGEAFRAAVVRFSRSRPGTGAESGRRKITQSRVVAQSESFRSP